MTPSKLILALVVLLLAALAIARQAQLLREERSFESEWPERAPWGWMGCQLAQFEPDPAGESTGEPGEGVLIVQVVPGSPAQMAGLLPGDVIRRMGEQDITGWHDLRRVLRSTRPGQVMNFHVIRDKQLRQITLTLGKRPVPPPPPPPDLPY